MSSGVLHNFYKSKKWRDFRKNIIIERGLVCEECGKTILDSKELHVHHIKELNKDNYLDATISLNPDNVKILCHQCHNKTHNRFCKGRKVVRKEKAVYIVYGPPMSGKTSYVLENMEPGDIVVDMDRLYQAVSLQDLYNKPDNLKFNVLAIRNSILDNIKTRYGNFKVAWIIGGYSDKYSREQLVKELGAQLIFIDVSKEECISRLNSCGDYRQEHKEEWQMYIEEWFERYSK
ncbi:HNH endonuclease [Clostridium botulinum C]|uniref:HNH endonuclease signature motif containing protein n=1 Tax=Clostridium botulinum TaxID=1491 RepID=UPI001E337BB5|nr:HNH endonuclease signature motif containing protein [Clostridium botulinum]MCD3206783.1 HNH endonuclease [Clostridium botulinum C]MCD3209562.1 HNH endonuclease [Clostridium botulinum C]MCD3226583.1 HNH endonuclease [Clostridium botulinum C]MCD3249016.1 HNH endonuclease [Clostridium botulinum C]MCD3257453.1 HNH endonuclease [Clostridium botulinum C]